MKAFMTLFMFSAFSTGALADCREIYEGYYKEAVLNMKLGAGVAVGTAVSSGLSVTLLAPNPSLVMPLLLGPTIVASAAESFSEGSSATSAFKTEEMTLAVSLIDDAEAGDGAILRETHSVLLQNGQISTSMSQSDLAEIIREKNDKRELCPATEKHTKEIVFDGHRVLGFKELIKKITE